MVEEIPSKGLGDLIAQLIDLKTEFENKLVDECISTQYPPGLDKYLNPKFYNERIKEDYKQRQEELISEINKLWRDIPPFLLNSLK